LAAPAASRQAQKAAITPKRKANGMAPVRRVLTAISAMTTVKISSPRLNRRDTAAVTPVTCSSFTCWTRELGRCVPLPLACA
jgi:hypothetical protein